MSTHPDILIQSERWHDILPDTENTVAHICATVFSQIEASHPLPEGTEISIVLADDAFIRTLNASYRSKDAPTNVLSFPAQELIPGKPFPITGEEMEITLGDVILALETIEREAVEQHKTFEAHVTHMLVHGILHLLGYDHMNDKEADAMESLEVTILHYLNITNPYEEKA